MRLMLKDRYNNSKQVLTMLKARYGLNELGVKKILQIDKKRYNKLAELNGEVNSSEKEILFTLFPELRGRL